MSGLWPDAHDAPQQILRFVRLEQALHGIVHLTPVVLNQDPSLLPQARTWTLELQGQRQTLTHWWFVPSKDLLPRVWACSSFSSSRPLPRRQPTSSCEVALSPREGLTKAPPSLIVLWLRARPDCA